MLCWHVTSGPAALSILEAGFEGGWGDDGFGVYVFTCLSGAGSYLARGGWDGRLDPAAAVILEIDCDESELRGIDIHPDWPNPEAYLSILMHPMEDEDGIWAPVRRILPAPDVPEPTFG